MSSSSTSSDSSDEVHFDSPHAFWVTTGGDHSGQVAYNWKKEGWEFTGPDTDPVVRWQHIHQIIEQPLQPAHTKARQQFKRLGYPALPDEDLGFFYDPSMVDYRSTLRVAVQSASEHPLGLTPHQQVWEAWNALQYTCMGCRVQQFRGSFFGDETSIQIEHLSCTSNGRPSEDMLSSSSAGRWAFDEQRSAPTGPYIATDYFGGWKAASPVTTVRYNEILRNAIKSEIQHRHQNEERALSLRDPLHWRHSTNGVPTYHHPIAGSWKPLGRHPDRERLQTTLPPLTPGFQASDPSQSIKGWLTLRAERQLARSRLSTQTRLSSD